METSICYLFTVPLEPDYKHTYYFQTPKEQTDYFLDRARNKLYTSEFSYIRKDGVIRFPEKFDTIIENNINYCMYQNPGDNSGKWYYAFVTDIKYKSEGMTEIYIETDVIQTWLFKYEVMPSFIEREHIKVADDIPGAYTLEEGLELGEYVSSERIDFIPLSNTFENVADNLGIVVGATSDLTHGNFPATSGAVYNGVYSGMKYYFFDNENTVNEMLINAAEKGKAESIQCMFIAPKSFVAYNSSNKKIASSNDCKSVLWSQASLEKYNGAMITQPRIYKPKKIGTYEPKNKKLLSFPFCYLNMQNNAGATALYRYEDFYHGDESIPADVCDFEIHFSLTPGCSIRLHPRCYKGLLENVEEGLTGAKFPICNWATDVYTNWLTQNSANIQVALGSSAIGGITSLLTLDGGGVMNSLSSIAGTLAEKHARSFQPPQVEGNTNSGDVMFSKGFSTFTAVPMHIKEEYAKIIDDFFNMYGYKIHRVKRPFMNHRAHFWYIKTIDANIDGDFPTADLQKIKEAYNNGITFWRNHANLGNYGLAVSN